MPPLRSRECHEYQLSAVRLSRIDFHICIFFVCLYYLRHVREIELRIDSVAEHVHRYRYDIDVSCPLAVAEERSLDPVAACEESQLGVCNGCSSVIVRMERDDQVFPVVEVCTHIFDL